MASLGRYESAVRGLQHALYSFLKKRSSCRLLSSRSGTIESPCCIPCYLRGGYRRSASASGLLLFLSHACRASPPALHNGAMWEMVWWSRKRGVAERTDALIVLQIVSFPSPFPTMNFHKRQARPAPSLSVTDYCNTQLANHPSVRILTAARTLERHRKRTTLAQVPLKKEIR